MSDDLSAVAAAYRSVRESGGMDLPARDAAEAIYRERHPEAGPDMSRMVAILIHEASLNGMLWPRRSQLDYRFIENRVLESDLCKAN